MDGSHRKAGDMKISSIQSEYGEWKAWIIVDETSASSCQVAVTSNVDFEDCLIKARDFMDALTKGRAECERRNAERAGK